MIIPAKLGTTAKREILTMDEPEMKLPIIELSYLPLAPVAIS